MTPGPDGFHHASAFVSEHCGEECRVDLVPDDGVGVADASGDDSDLDLIEFWGAEFNGGDLEWLVG